MLGAKTIYLAGALAVSRAIANGWDVTTAGNYFGHTPQVMLSIYSHGTIEDARAAAKALPPISGLEPALLIDYPRIRAQNDETSRPELFRARQAGGFAGRDYAARVDRGTRPRRRRRSWHDA